MSDIKSLRESYSAAVTEGLNIEQLAGKLGIKVESLNQNLTLARKDLRAIGATEEDIKAIFPPLVRRTGPRGSKRKAALAEMLASVQKPETPDNDADVVL